MDRSLYTGRKVQKHIYKTLLAPALGKKKKADAAGEAVVPRIFLLYGENGVGKTAMIDLCLQNVAEIAAENLPATPIVLDLDTWQFRNGIAPKTPRAMLDALYAVVSSAHESFAAQLQPYDQVVGKIAEVEKSRDYFTAVEWPRELFSSGTIDAAAAGEADFQAWLEKKIDPADLALAGNPSGYLTETFAECLTAISKKFPLVIGIDSLELAATSEIERWLKTSFLPLLIDKKGTIVLILSGANDFVKSIRNDFPEELLYPVAPACVPLSQNDIAALAAKRGAELTPEQIGKISDATAGIPLAVQAIIDHVGQNISLSKVLPGKPAADIAGLVRETVDRFLRHADGTYREKLSACSLLFRLDENVLSQVWGIPQAEVAGAVAEIAGRYPSLMQEGGVSGTVRECIRSHLVSEADGKSAASELMKTFGAAQAELYGQYLVQEQTGMPDAALRYANPGYQITILGLLNSLVLSSQNELQRLLPGFFVEALHFNREFAATLLDFAGDFSPLLGKESVAMIGALSEGLTNAADAVRSPVLPGSHGDPRAMEFFNKYLTSLASTMTDFQKALLHRMKGVIACQAGKLDKAMEEFSASAGLLAADAPEQALLFGNFLCAGYAFGATGEKKKAIAAFGKAVVINPEDFFAWREMAFAQQSLGDHKAAAKSFGEAVRINANAGEAWFELGNEYAALDEHAQAIEAFTRATTIESDRPATWFHLGLSLEAVSRFPEAQKALENAIAIIPDHWEALFALGRAFTAQALSQEAIDAYNKAVAAKPDCTDAWKALGSELLQVRSYETAAGALEKAAELDSANPELWHTIGKAWLGAAIYDNSVRACQKAVELRNDFFEAWVTLGQGQTDLNNFKDACESFTTAAGLNPKDPEIWVSVGNSLYAQGKYQESIEAFLKATELRPDTDTIWHNIGLAYQVQRKFAEAVDAFQKSIAVNPDVAEVWYQQGRCYAELGQHADAAACFTKTVELTPDAHDAWYRKGLSLAKSDNHAEAVTAFIKATELYPSDADIWYQLGLSYVATGNPADAVRVFTQSLACTPNRPEVLYQLGLAQESLGQCEEAIASYQKSIELSPDKADAWLHLGMCGNMLSRHAEALPAFKKVLELVPENRDVFLPLALAAHAVGEYGEAVDYYRKVIEDKPDSEEALYNCALALHALNTYEEAIKMYQTVVEQFPGKDQAWYNMGLAYHATNDFKQATASYREASKLNPESPEIWYQLGMVFYTTEQYGEAILAFRKVVTRKPDMIEAWVNLGNSYLVWREFNDAISAYQKVIDLKPDDYSGWGYLGNAYYAAAMFDKAVQADARAFELKSDEAWVICNLALAKFFAGDTAGADPMFDALLAADATGQELGKAVAELQKAMKRKPPVAGAKEMLQKLTGGNR